jgi:hypothetical protein
MLLLALRCCFKTLTSGNIVIHQSIHTRFLNLSTPTRVWLHVGEWMKTNTKACHQCRQSKRRCGGLLGATCTPCNKRGLTCSSAIQIRQKAILKPTASLESSSSPRTPNAATRRDDGDTLASTDQETVAELVELYIECIHDKPHSLFHVPTLRADVAAQSIDRALLCSILALSARFASTEEVRNLGPKFFFQAKRLLTQDLEAISLSRIQAWVIAGNVAGADSNSTSESLFFGIAIRSAHLLGLAQHNAEDGAVLRETKSRIWWTLYMIDRWSSAGLGTPRQLERQETQQLPLDEYDFYRVAVGQQRWDSPTKLGMWAYMIFLAELFGPITDLNHLIASGKASEEHVSSQVVTLFSNLQRWQDNLPRTFRLNSENLTFHKTRGHGRTFVALHLGYFHYATLLSFHFLDQSSASLPFAETYAERCRQHASAFSDLLKTSYELDAQGMHNIVGHMTVVSSSVLLHTLLFGSEDQLPSAKRQLESNFNILIRLKAWWPSVAQMTDRLFLFQRVCLRTVDNHTHKIDHWMVKFLLEHAILLEDKSDASRLESTSPQDFAASEAPELHRLSERGRFTKNALSGLRA